jgi:hypothetical protein
MKCPAKGWVLVNRKTGNIPNFFPRATEELAWADFEDEFSRSYLEAQYRTAHIEIKETPADD